MGAEFSYRRPLLVALDTIYSFVSGVHTGDDSWHEFPRRAAEDLVLSAVLAQRVVV